VFTSASSPSVVSMTDVSVLLDLVGEPVCYISLIDYTFSSSLIRQSQPLLRSPRPGLSDKSRRLYRLLSLIS
jgi:hypothetical protein